MRWISPAEVYNLRDSIDLLERENQHLRDIISDMLDRHAAELARERARMLPSWEPWSLGESG